MSILRINTYDIRPALREIHCGDEVLLSGEVYTARDAAHKKIVTLLDSGDRTPFEIKDAVIYYAGPTPAKNGLAVGACGPTTSSRMDTYSPRLISLGLAAMLGKGPRSQEVIDAMVRFGAVYLCAIGGAGALAARCIKNAEVIAFPELGCESVKRFEIEDFPLICGIDCFGESIFDRSGRR